MRGKLSRGDRVVVADGQVLFGKVKDNGQFVFSGPEKVSMGDYLLTLETGRSFVVNVYLGLEKEADDTILNFTRSMQAGD